MNLKRFGFEHDDPLLFTENPEGEYVLWEKAITTLTQRDAEIARLRAELDKCFCKSCRGTGRIDSDGFCGNCDLGRTKSELDAAKAVIAEMQQVLKDVEWTRRVDDTNQKYCPWCGNIPSWGHAPNCKLSALVAKENPNAKA